MSRRLLAGLLLIITAALVLLLYVVDPLLQNAISHSARSNDKTEIIFLFPAEDE